MLSGRTHHGNGGKKKQGTRSDTKGIQRESENGKKFLPPEKQQGTHKKYRHRSLVGCAPLPGGTISCRTAQKSRQGERGRKKSKKLQGNAYAVRQRKYIHTRLMPFLKDFAAFLPRMPCC